MITVRPSVFSAGLSITRTPARASSSTIRGLWMSSPSVQAGVPERASAKAASTARRTPKQKPAVFATVIRFKSRPPAA